MLAFLKPEAASASFPSRRFVGPKSSRLCYLTVTSMAAVTARSMSSSNDKCSMNASMHWASAIPGRESELSTFECSEILGAVKCRVAGRS